MSFAQCPSCPQLIHFFTVLPGGYFGGAFDAIAFNIAYEGGAFSFAAVFTFGGAFLGGSFGGLGGVDHGDGFVFAA